MSNDVFISHSSHNGTIAATVCAGLEARGLSCWIAPRDIQPGESWGASIVRALDDCPVMVLVLTAQANASRHVVREVERADGKQARIITFRVDNVALNPTLEYFLSAEHWFDAMGRPVETHLPALAASVHSLRGLARSATRAPNRSNAPPLPTVPLDDRALVSTFDELAPDDWNNAPRGKLARFFQGLFDDRR